MTAAEIKRWLEQEQSEFPERASGEEFYGFMKKLAGRLVKDHRLSLVQALQDWIHERNVPHTDLALDIATEYHLQELVPEIEQLLVDIKHHRAFLPYYVEHVEEVLRQLNSP
jgi:hypothetical protein